MLALTRPGIDVSMPRGVLIPLQLLAVLALAELSYRFVEVPFRRRPDPADPATDWLRYGRPALLAGVLAVVFAVGWSGISGSGTDELAAQARAASTAESAPSGRRTRRRPQPRTARRPKPPRIVALGDSVMIGAKERLAARLGRRFSMNAKVSRQADEFVDLVERLKARGGNVDALIIQMGNNGPLYSDEMEAIRRATRGVGELFLINDLAPVSWSGESDEKLAEAAEDLAPHGTDRLALGRRRHQDSLTWDGLHLTPAGAGVYTRLITARCGRRSWPKLPSRPKAQADEPPRNPKGKSHTSRSRRGPSKQAWSRAARGAGRDERERVRRRSSSAAASPAARRRPSSAARARGSRWSRATPLPTTTR